MWKTPLQKLRITLLATLSFLLLSCSGYQSIALQSPEPGTIEESLIRVTLEATIEPYEDWPLPEPVYRCGGSNSDAMTAGPQFFDWSPNGKTIAILAEDIHLLPVDYNQKTISTGQPIQITYEGNSFSMIWSPDSQSLAYYALHDDTAYLINIDNHQTIALGTKIIPKQWSMDGQFIVATESRHISLMHTSSKEIVRLTQFPINSDPILSPDGQNIIFAYYDKPEDTANIYRLTIDTGEITIISDESVCDFSPIWSPNGELIAFQSDRSGSWELFVMNADGSNPTQITFDATATEWDFAWSPDGQQIAFLADLGGSYTADESALYVVNLDGSNLTQLVEQRDDECCFKYVSWSPDGNWLAFLYVATTDNCLYDSCEWHIDILEMATGVRTRIFTLPNLYGK